MTSSSSDPTVAALASDAEPSVAAAAAAAAPVRKRPKPGERRVQILQTLASMLEQPGAEIGRAHV